MREWLSSEGYLLPWKSGGPGFGSQNLCNKLCSCKACNPSSKKRKDERVARLAGVHPPQKSGSPKEPRLQEEAEGGASCLYSPLQDHSNEQHTQLTSFIKGCSFIFISTFVCESECHACAVPTEASRGHRIPWNWSYEPLCECWELNLGPLQEQPVSFSLNQLSSPSFNLHHPSAGMSSIYHHLGLLLRTQTLSFYVHGDDFTP